MDVTDQCAVLRVLGAKGGQDVGDHGQGVGLPEDGIGAIAPRRLEHVEENGMKGAEGDAGKGLGSQLVEALLHFPCGSA